ncbi:fumarylacetoacetase [Pseudomonas sp. NPDC089752]|uniref:fumarylacetoacetase n=1 Tax=Pseudomonas sp. NPDC089752 TaxID=3364472 RepID=UPI00381DA9E7
MNQNSWIESANGHPEFPLQNLPLGIFSAGGGARTSGIAIGEYVLDLEGVLNSGLLDNEAETAVLATRGGSLHKYFDLGRIHRVALRNQVMALLTEGSEHAEVVALHLRPMEQCEIHLPSKISDYTDFYVGIEHAVNVGKLFRPDNPLLPNYKYVPIGYHGRASTIRPSGVDVIRPVGQTLAPGSSVPAVGPTDRLDFELELGVWIGTGNGLGQPIPISSARDHIAGYCLLNDWSARDIQAWEYQPLGPFLSKSFHTTISPWIITAEALEPFRCRVPARPDGDPAPLDYLSDNQDQAQGLFDIQLEVLITTEAMRKSELPPHRLSLSNTQVMYWTPAQMVTHHAVNGCQLQPGDLLGSGTLSGPHPSQYGSLLELTKGGKEPIALPSGEHRYFLEDGDEVIMRARCVREGHESIGFGECKAKVVAQIQGLGNC